MKPLPRIHWALVLLITLFVLLLADRYRYLSRFGFVYTEADQATLWYQADDLARGIFREPCFYGQNYNVPIEAWLAAPLIFLHVPHHIALPLAAVTFSLLPFVALAIVAYRNGKRWMACVIPLIPLALPVEYLVVSSIPRGFITGIAVATPAVALWIFARSKRAFFFAAFFAILALTVNPSCSIILLAAGVFALLTHFRSRVFYRFSFLGALVALPIPLLINLFYKYHPECDAYHPKWDSAFHWQTLRDSFGSDLDLFFADFIPIAHRGWYMLIILPAMIVLLLIFRRFKAAIAIFITSTFIIFTLGIDRVHSALPHAFYSGSRMYLALPVLFAIFLIWLDGPKKYHAIARAIIFCALATFARFRDISQLNAPSPLVQYTPPLTVAKVDDLAADCRVIADVCKKYNVSLVLPANSRETCFNEAAPVLANHAFETLYPPFERRTFRIAQERTQLHTNVLVYRPAFYQNLLAMQQFPNSKIISDSPKLLLIQIDSPGRSGFDIAQSIGLFYRSRF
jgi:hypothetical protein